MRKLLGADDPAPSVAAMRACGVLLRLLPGAGTGLLLVLIHVEEVAGLSPDWLRRLVALGGEDVAEALRMSKADAAQMVRLREGLENTVPAPELGYRLGAARAVDILALRAAAFEREVEPELIEQARDGAGQHFPITAADLMPAFTGPALGKKLAELETRWLNSGFTLGREALLAE